MAVVGADAQSVNKSSEQLAEDIRIIFVKKLTQNRIEYSQKSLIENGLLTLLFITLLVLFFWITTKVFPWLNEKLSLSEGKIIKTISLKGKELIKSSSQIAILRVLLQGLRLAISLFAIYQFIVALLKRWPYTDWLAISFSNFYKVGDRVQLGGNVGDVIDIGILRTTLMECRQ